MRSIILRQRVAGLQLPATSRLQVPLEKASRRRWAVGAPMNPSHLGDVCGLSSVFTPTDC